MSKDSTLAYATLLSDDAPADGSSRFNGSNKKKNAELISALDLLLRQQLWDESLKFVASRVDQVRIRSQEILLIEFISCAGQRACRAVPSAPARFPREQPARAVLRSRVEPLSAVFHHEGAVCGAQVHIGIRAPITDEHDRLCPAEIATIPLSSSV